MIHTWKTIRNYSNLIRDEISLINAQRTFQNIQFSAVFCIYVFYELESKTSPMLIAQCSMYIVVLNFYDFGYFHSKTHAECQNNSLNVFFLLLLFFE